MRRLVTLTALMFCLGLASCGDQGDSAPTPTADNQSGGGVGAAPAPEADDGAPASCGACGGAPPPDKALPPPSSCGAGSSCGGAAPPDEAPPDEAPPDEAPPAPALEPGPPVIGDRDPVEFDKESETIRRVFFATDRQRLDPTLSWHLTRFVIPLAAVLLTVALFFLSRRGMSPWVRWPLFLIAIGGLGWWSVHKAVDSLRIAERHGRLGILFSEKQREASSDAPFYATVDGQAGRLQLGIVDISIPRAHERGGLEVLEGLTVTPDPTKVFMVETIEFRNEPTFFDELRASVSEPCADCDDPSCEETCTARDAFVFVHGYNTTFEIATFRTAQIAHDLDFRGAAICYSWCSRGRLAQYTRDVGAINRTKSRLQRFLRELRARSGARKIHLVAHSMGNRALMRSVADIASQLRDENKPFNHVVLAAPDISKTEFEEDIAPRITGAAETVTLYVCAHDHALQASHKVHDVQRAGEVRENNQVAVEEGIDTVDVTPVASGHSYIASNGRVLNDFRVLLRHRHDAGRRAALAAQLQLPYRLTQKKNASMRPFWQIEFVKQ